MERVVPIVDQTIALAQTKFIGDPVAGTKYSRATSIISSGFPIVERVEQANEYFRARLHQLLETS